MFLKSARMLAYALSQSPSPRRMAAGIALGVAVGLVPKGNLLGLGLLTLLCCLNINVVAGLLTATLVSLVSYHADAAFHVLGRSLLTYDGLKPVWTWVSAQPLAAWTDFNNTVVLGSFCLALVGVVPVYWLTLPLCRRLVPAMSERVQRWKIVQWLTGVSIAGRVTAASP